jgi:hypothetical protein
MGLRRAAHVAWRKVGNETVLIHLKNKQIYVLNESGGFFWHSLDGDRDLGQILTEIGLRDEAGSLAPFAKCLEDADLVELGEPGKNVPGPRLVPSAKRAPEYPFANFVPPELVWQQELRNFGLSCAFVSGAGAACDAVPTT